MRHATGTDEARADELCNHDAIAQNMAALGYVREVGGQWVKSGQSADTGDGSLPTTLSTEWPQVTTYVRRHGRQRSRRAHAVQYDPQNADQSMTEAQ